MAGHKYLLIYVPEYAQDGLLAGKFDTREEAEELSKKPGFAECVCKIEEVSE